MSYFPKLTNTLGKSLDLADFIQDQHWHRINYIDIDAGDRILTVRMSGGTRLISESEVFEFDNINGYWINSMGTPVVTARDTHIFRAGEYREDQSAEHPEMLLGD